MKVSTHQIADALVKRTLVPSLNEPQFAREVAAYLLDTGRTGQLNSLARDMIKARTLSGVIEVTAVSAHELTEVTRTDIRARVKQLYPSVKRVIISERRDANIIGGVRLEFPEQQLDLSVRSKLNRFKALTT